MGYGIGDKGFTMDALANHSRSKNASRERIAKINAGWTPGYRGLVAPGKNAFGATKEQLDPAKGSRFGSPRTRSSKTSSADPLLGEWTETLGEADDEGYQPRNMFQKSTGTSKTYDPKTDTWKTRGKSANVFPTQSEQPLKDQRTHTSFGSFDPNRMTYKQAEKMYAEQNSPEAVAGRKQFEIDNPFMSTAQGDVRRYKTDGADGIQVYEGAWNQDDWKAYDMEQSGAPINDGLMIPERKLSTIGQPEPKTQKPPGALNAPKPLIGTAPETVPRANIYSNPALKNAQDIGTNVWKGAGQLASQSLDASPIGMAQRGISNVVSGGVNKLKDLRDLSTNYSTRQIQANKPLQPAQPLQQDKYANFTGGDDQASVALETSMIKDVQDAGSKEEAMKLLSKTGVKLAQQQLAQYIEEAYGDLLTADAPETI